MLPDPEDKEGGDKRLLCWITVFLKETGRGNGVSCFLAPFGEFT